MRKSILVTVFPVVLGLVSHWAAGQCEFVATSVTPNIAGRHLNPPYLYVVFKASATDPSIHVNDGDLMTFDTGAQFGGPYVFEFDTDNSVAPGNIAVPLTATDNFTSSRALVEVVKAHPSLPFSALVAPVGPDDQYVSFVFKKNEGYGAGVSRTLAVPGAITGSATSFAYQTSGNVWFQIAGSNLHPGSPHIVAKFVSQADPTKVITTTSTIRTAEVLTVRASLGLGATPFPAGVYDLVLSRATTPACPDFVLPGALTIVDNLLSDPTFQTNILGNAGTLMWNVEYNTAWLPLVWHHNNVNITNSFADGVFYEAVKRGDKFHPMQQEKPTRKEAPRQAPFPTGPLESTAGDNEWATLRWDPANGIGIGRHQFWQYIDINLSETSFVTLSGVWLGGTTSPSTLTYGIEIRDGDENGTILAQTPPQQTIDSFYWTPFSYVMTLPAGQRRVACVIYGDNSDDVDAGLHIDDLLLRVGAEFWPDVDGDGDIDQADFSSFQACYTGAGAGVVAAGCERFDREADMDVDAADFEAFERCATGPGIRLTPVAVAAGCEP
ncbi:MAG TPA: hypothetical protein PLL20_05015 [Phycisphaerae bacterium]|nr:hypothetical protein [Phycisphaerae bacterium]HRR84686.1 hypothetical protein [Phycisphaerae bacterium]